MKSAEWTDEEPTFEGSWLNKDAFDAWEAFILEFPGKPASATSGAYDAAAPYCKAAGTNSDLYVVALAAVKCPEFKDMCAMSEGELEALREVAGRGSLVWAYLTAALVWKELPRSKLPSNAPSKLP